MIPNRTSPKPARGALAPALACAAALAATAAAAPIAAAAGAWQTWAYPGTFTDLIATPSEVWGATREGGLLRFDRAARAIEMIHHEAGGLASNELTAVALDRSGRLWVGTVGNGVSRRRADGAGWDLVNSFDGLPVDSVTALHAAGDTVWIGTTRGLALWNGQEITGSLPDGNTVSFDTTFSSIAITAIVQAGDSLWLGTRRGVGYAHLSTGLADWRPANTGIDPVRMDVEDLVTDGTHLIEVGVGYAYRWRPEQRDWQFLNAEATSAFGGPGVMLLGTLTGIARWNGFNVTPLPGAPLPVPKGTDSYLDLVRPLQAPDGRVYGATANLLYEETAPGAWSPAEIPCPPDNNLVDLELRGATVYVGAFTGGVGRWDGTRWRQWKSGICLAGCDTTFKNPIFVVGMLADPEGHTWAGSWSVAFESFTDDGPAPAFRRHWDVVGSGDAAVQLARRTWTFSAAADSFGGRWFGLDTAERDTYAPLGLAYHDPDENFVDIYDLADGLSGLFVRGLAVDENGRLWLGYEGEGVDFAILEPGPPYPKIAPPGFVHLNATSTLLVRAIHPYGDSIWVATPSAVYRFGSRSSASSAALQTFTYPGGQDQFAIHPLATSANGTLWVGTGAGLREYRPDGTTNVYTTANSPLASNVIRSLKTDPATDDLWIATSAGLHRFDPQYVPPAPPPIERLAVRVWPNPAKLTGAGTTLRLSGDAASYRGRIYDVGGRELRSFATSANGQVFWDGRDDDGHLVPPGVYLARVEAGGREAFARFVLLR